MMKVIVEEDKQLGRDLLVLRVKKKSPKIDKIAQEISSEPQELTVRLNERHVIISTKEVVRIFSNQKKVYLETFTDEFIIERRLYDLIEELPGYFVRISNTEIINLNKVREFELSKTGHIIIHFKNQSMTSSSRRYLKQVKERLLWLNK